jgi:hypothetical protein
MQGRRGGRILRVPTTDVKSVNCIPSKKKSDKTALVKYSDHGARADERTPGASVSGSRHGTPRCFPSFKLTRSPWSLGVWGSSDDVSMA